MSDLSVPVAPQLGQKLIAEFLGTFVLVFFGIAVAVMIYAVGRISGGHFNPAVSIGAAIGGRVPWSEALVHMVTQVLGATVGALALFIVAHGYDGFAGDREDHQDEDRGQDQLEQERGRPRDAGGADGVPQGVGGCPDRDFSGRRRTHPDPAPAVSRPGVRAG